MTSPSHTNTPAHTYKKQAFIHFYYFNLMSLMSHIHIYIVFPPHSSISIKPALL